MEHVKGVLRILSSARNSVGFSQREGSVTVIWRGQVPGSLHWRRKQLENGQRPAEERFEKAALIVRFGLPSTLIRSLKGEKAYHFDTLKSKGERE